MSTDDDLRAAQRKGDARKADNLLRRLGVDATKRLAAEFRSEVIKLRQEILEHGYAVKRAEERIAFLDSVSSAMMPEPCKPCGGRGKFRHWVAQDESHLEDCTACKGTGFA